MGVSGNDESPDAHERPSPGWGSEFGHLDVPADTDPSTRWDALAIHLVTERIHRYGWSFDERRADLLSDCFTEDATWSGNIGGAAPIAPRHGRVEIVGWLTEFWNHQTDQRRHHMMSVSVKLVDDGHAVALASLLLTAASEGTLAIVLTSFYRFELKCAEGAWQISSLFEGCDVTF